MFNSQIYLGKLTETIEHGEVIESIAWEMRLANRLDDERSEFYQAARSGLKPELTFEVNAFEYSDEEFLKYDGVKYTIIRAGRRDEKFELVCSTHTGSDSYGTQA